jgi:glycosyltransferase involved in cell wall biosynthesis
MMNPSSPRRINVLRVITWLPVGGIERRLVALLPRLDRERFNVSLVCIRERGALAGELEAAGVPVHCIPFRKRWDLRALRQLAALMREQEIDIVHSHMYRSNVPAKVAARLAGVRHVWTQVHNVGTWETPRQTLMDRFLCRWRTGVIAVSERVREDVMRTLRLPGERVKLVYNGVDLARFAGARVKRNEVRDRCGVGANDVVLLFAARLVEQKRAQDFLSAVGTLQREEGGGRLRVWILGDGPLMEELKKQADGLPAPAAVTFFGKRSDVEEFMAGADIFVLPSTREGFSNALVEAMASGLASVATDVGGNAEAIRSGVEGLIVPPLQVERLTGALRELVNDDEKRRAMAEAAARRAELYSLDKMKETVERLYLETMEKP